MLLLCGTVLPYTEGSGAYRKYHEGQYLASLKTYQAALQTAVKNADQKKEVIYLNNLATVFHAMEKPDSAQAYLDRAVKACMGDVNLLFMVRVNEALRNGGAGPDISSRALSGARERLSGYEYGALLTGCGELLLLKGETGKAAGLFKKARKSFEDGENSVGYARAIFFMAQTELRKGNLNTALKTADEALVLFQKGNYTRCIRQALTLKEEIYRKKDDTASADRMRALRERLP
jgi:tetratricopeptide (TPR) repeat protein